MVILDRSETGHARWLDRLADAPAWAKFVGAVVTVASALVGWAVIDVVRDGVARPALFIGGIVAVWVVSYVYVTVVQRGELLEAIDLSEAPVIALALVLPPGEAILAVAAGSILSQLQPHRSTAKKAFNVAIRVLGVGALELVVQLAHSGHSRRSGAPIPVVLPAATLYTAVGLVGITTVIMLVQGGSFRSHLGRAGTTRVVAWAASAVMGTCAATVAVIHPLALAGVCSALALVWYTTQSLHREQSERRRLECLVDATSRLLDATDEKERESAALEAAHKLLLWRDVSVRDEPPDADEFGVVLWCVGNHSRWLVCRPRVGSDTWTDEDQRIIDAIGAASASAYERARAQQELVQHARVDALTGLANRREFDARLDDALALSTEVGVVLLDLDAFKPINDSLGHDVGDEVLRAVAGRLTGVVRTTDVAARIGGDEFVVLLPGATRAIAERVATDICEAIAEPLHVGDWRLKVTASAGVAVTKADGNCRPDLMRCADRRMYSMKSSRASRTFIAVGNADGRTEPVLSAVNPLSSARQTPLVN